jgi:tRNA G10  N-methylase Trm11
VTAVVLRGDARRLPLPDASVDLIVTSPPYEWEANRAR